MARDNKRNPDGHGTDALQVGARIRHARQLEGMRIKDLAERVGCATSMISKIETGRVAPSLAMLNRLVQALHRDLSSFFSEDIDSPGIVQRAGERTVSHTDALRGGIGVTYERLVPLAAGHLLEGNIHIIEPGGEKVDTITHQGETLGYVLEGELELTIDDTTYKLSEGCSFFFKNHLTNKYRNTGCSSARLIWVNTPQIH
jgi:transcriptional regulator with XRE-family HTH domain